jgi:hypothetical protein
MWKIRAYNRQQEVIGAFRLNSEAVLQRKELAVERFINLNILLLPLNSYKNFKNGNAK